MNMTPKNKEGPKNEKGPENEEDTKNEGNRNNEDNPNNKDNLRKDVDIFSIGEVALQKVFTYSYGICRFVLFLFL